MRGEIVHRDRARQILDFSGMSFDYKITPTDIDGLIEYRNKCFIFFEVKYKNGDEIAPFLFGQRLALERIIDNLDKPAILFVASHTIADSNNDINAAECVIELYYWHHNWHETNGRVVTLKTACDNFLEKYGE